MEEVVHDYDKMCSMSVIEDELTLLAALMKKAANADEKGFYKTKIENVEFAKSTIETNVTCQILSAD